MLIGYARVSTQDQNPELQTDALAATGCKKVFTEKASGAQRERPQLREALEYMRDGDILVVWKLDRLARSLVSHLGRPAGQGRPDAAQARCDHRRGGRVHDRQRQDGEEQPEASGVGERHRPTFPVFVGAATRCRTPRQL